MKLIGGLTKITRPKKENSMVNQFVNARTNPQSKAQSTPKNISIKICVITSILLK